jgi:hypothetical protein
VTVKNTFIDIAPDGEGLLGNWLISAFQRSDDVILVMARCG